MADGKCGFCGCYHGALCPEVKALEYHPDGSLKRVEFKSIAEKVQVATYQVPSHWPAASPTVAAWTAG